MSLTQEYASLIEETKKSNLEEQCANHSLMKQVFSQNVSSSFKQQAEIEGALPVSKLMLNYFKEPAEVLDSTINYYFVDFWKQNGDERTSKLPFMSAGPWKLIIATAVYLYLIKVALPNLMRNRKAYELNWIIRIYNLMMVFSNLYAFIHGARIMNFGTKCFGCEVINHQDHSASTMELIHYGWLFVLSRLVEWLDTIFFVLRKKERQVTKLHIFHHSFVPIFSWFYLKFLPGYTVAFFPLVNTFVHTIMYAYYFLATFGPKVQAYLWWKRYLTSLQIAQFVLILIQLISIPLSMNEKCQYPRSFLIAAFAGAVLFLWLFFSYYLDTYKKPKREQTSSTPNKEIGVDKSRETASGRDNAIVQELDATAKAKKKLV